MEYPRFGSFEYVTVLRRHFARQRAWMIGGMILLILGTAIWSHSMYLFGRAAGIRYATEQIEAGVIRYHEKKEAR